MAGEGGETDVRGGGKRVNILNLRQLGKQTNTLVSFVQLLEKDETSKCLLNYHILTLVGNNIAFERGGIQLCLVQVVQSSSCINTTCASESCKTSSQESRAPKLIRVTTTKTQNMTASTYLSLIHI